MWYETLMKEKRHTRRMNKDEQKQDLKEFLDELMTDMENGTPKPGTTIYRTKIR